MYAIIWFLKLIDWPKRRDNGHRTANLCSWRIFTFRASPCIKLLFWSCKNLLHLLLWFHFDVFSCNSLLIKRPLIFSQLQSMLEPFLWRKRNATELSDEHVQERQVPLLYLYWWKGLSLNLPSTETSIKYFIISIKRLPPSFWFCWTFPMKVFKE